MSADNFANNLDPDQALQNIGPYLDPKLFDTMMVFLMFFFFLKLILKKKISR